MAIRPLSSTRAKSTIWALAVDQKGNLYAGTGEKGIVYKIGPDGRGEPFYKTKATHATALAVDGTGNLLVGTESPGRVLRVDPGGKAFVLFDSPYQEIHTLRFDPAGMLYAAAQSGRAPGAAPGVFEDRGLERSPAETGRFPVPSVSAEITSMAIVDVSGAAGASASTREERRAVKGAVYRIAPDGAWDLLWESREDSPYALAFDEHGAVVIGTGSKGKVYRLEGDPLRPTLLTRAGAQQVTAFYTAPKGQIYYATANPGKLFRLSSDRSARGTFESEARDAQTISTWGALSWHGTTPPGSRIALSTRSGNTETPDDTWSPWSSAYTNSEGSPITSPKARFLQWRAELTGKGDGPILTSVTAAYLQRNLRPVVRSITVYPPGIVFQKPFTSGEPDLAGFEDQTTPERKLAAAASNSAQGSSSAPALGRRAYQKGLQTLAWKADDENDDELTYDVLFRREDETTWKMLRHALNDPLTVWDTTTVPDGTYFVKIVASDLPSDPPAMALAGELESSAFEIDNLPPAIAIEGVTTENGHTKVVFQVRDDHSPIQKVEFSEDGLHWRGVFPGWHRRLEGGALRADTRRSALRSRGHHQGQRHDEQCRDGAHRRPSQQEIALGQAGARRPTGQLVCDRALSDARHWQVIPEVAAGVHGGMRHQPHHVHRDGESRHTGRIEPRV